MQKSVKKHINMENLNIQRNDRVFIVNDCVIVDGVKLPTPPVKSDNYCNCTVIDNKVYINGFEYKRGKWRRTLRAMWHNFF